jgi:hypothetical protein
MNLSQIDTVLSSVQLESLHNLRVYVLSELWSATDVRGNEVLFTVRPRFDRTSGVARGRDPAGKACRANAGFGRFTTAQKYAPRREADVLERRTLPCFPRDMSCGQRGRTNVPPVLHILCITRLDAVRPHFSRPHSSVELSGTADDDARISFRARHVTSRTDDFHAGRGTAASENERVGSTAECD